MKLSQLRGELLRHGVEEGLNNNEIMLLWHILDFDFTGKGISWPSRKTIKKRMGFDSERSISRFFETLETRGFIKRVIMKGKSNQYDWTPLIEKFSKYVNPSLTMLSTPLDKDVNPPLTMLSTPLDKDVNRISSIESLQSLNTLNRREEEATTPTFPKISEIAEEKKFNTVAQGMTEIFQKHDAIVPMQFVTPPRMGIGKQYTDLIFNNQWGDKLLPMTDFLLRCNPGRRWTALEVIRAWENGLPDAWQAGEHYDFESVMKQRKNRHSLPSFLKVEGKMTREQFTSGCEKTDKWEYQILARFAVMADLRFTTAAAWQEYVYSNLSIATELAAFSETDLARGFKRMKKAEYVTEYSLKTLKTFTLMKEKHGRKAI